MSHFPTREQRRQLARDNAKRPIKLEQIPRYQWPDPDSPQLKVWRSRDFLVQVFAAKPPAMARVSINRTEMDGNRWRDGITWDQVQRIKQEIGRGEQWAVEVFPADTELVNVANVRHIWLLAEAPAFAWKHEHDFVMPIGSFPRA